MARLVGTIERKKGREELFEGTARPDQKTMDLDRAESLKSEQKIINELRRTDSGIFCDSATKYGEAPKEGRATYSERPADMDERLQRKQEEEFDEAKELLKKIGRK